VGFRRGYKNKLFCEFLSTKKKDKSYNIARPTDSSFKYTIYKVLPTKSFKTYSRHIEIMLRETDILQWNADVVTL